MQDTPVSPSMAALDSISVQSSPDGGTTPATVNAYTETLGPCTISAGQAVSYTTISPEFAGMSLEDEGYYPGTLTVQIAGTVVIENGGSLSISKLSIGGTKEASPVIQGALGENALIVVKPGGSLYLGSVTVDVQGDGLLILQEPGGSVELIATQLEDGLAQWAPPMVDNRYDAVDDLWLQEGTVLEAELLPDNLKTTVQYQGAESDAEVALSWNLSGYDGQTTGELALTGSFIDEQGTTLASIQPLAMTVRWYRPDQIVVTSATWHGKDAAAVWLTFQALPEDAEVWGEISLDGVNWEVWEDFSVQPGVSDDEPTGIFYSPDSTPHYYRLFAEDEWTSSFWVSDAFLLPDSQDQQEDQEGNRGGSSSIYYPEREPALSPEAVPTEESVITETPAPTEEPVITETPIPTEEPAVSETPVSTQAQKPAETTPAPTPLATAQSPLPSSGTPSTQPDADADAQPAPTESQKDKLEVSSASTGEVPSRSLQLLLAGAGLLLCAGAGFAYYWFGSRGGRR